MLHTPLRRILMPGVMAPPQLGLVAWYRGDSLIGSAGVASSWKDKTSNAYDLTATNGPTMVVSAEIGGRATARFVQASDQYFTRATTPAVSQPWSIAAIGKCSTFTDGPNLASGTTGTFGLAYNSNLLQLYLGSGSNVMGSITLDVWRLHVALCNGNDSELYVDGALLSDTNNPGANGIAGLSVGKSPHWGDGKFEGDIAEVIVWDKLLDASERLHLYRYYRSYYRRP